MLFKRGGFRVGVFSPKEFCAVMCSRHAITFCMLLAAFMKCSLDLKEFGSHTVSGRNLAKVMGI